MLCSSESSGRTSPSRPSPRQQQLAKSPFDPRHDRLAFGIAEADIIFDQLGPLGGQHQPGIEHAAERRPARAIARAVGRTISSIARAFELGVSTGAGE
jgi:hypothetical protein